MRVRPLAIAVLLVFAIAACIVAGIVTRCHNPRVATGWRPPPVGTYAAQIRQLESADIDADVDAALSKCDRRLAGVMGNGPVIPGIPDPLNYMQYEKDFGFRFIPNTSDVIESAEQEHVQSAGYDYAKRYNMVLLGRLKGNAGASPASRSS
jgi:hypothetical protein